MHDQTKILLQKINNKLKDSPLIYFSRDPERALGLENVLENYHIASVEDSYILDELEKRGKSTFSLNRQGINFDLNSSLNLLNHEKTTEWVKNITANKAFYAQFFQFNNPVVPKIKDLNGTLLNNNASLNRQFETKLSQYRFLQENKIPIAKGEIIESNKINYKDLAVKYGEAFVIQIDRAHTGAGTFFIRSESDWNDFLKDYNGNIIKVSEFIQGEPYTINGCVTKAGVFVSGLQYQITGYKDLTSGEGSTVGNDWSYASQLAASSLQQAARITQDIGNLMKAKGYRGLFGIDLILKREEWFVIEINARQTANISMQTKLELEQDQIPLSLLHLAEFLDIEILVSSLQSPISKLEGSQVFLRAKKDLTIQRELKSGIYRLQSDNSAMSLAKDMYINIDEDGDMPLIWHSEGYSLDDIKEGGFVLLGQKIGTNKKKFEELARMQFKTGIIQNGKLLPWVLQAMKTFEEILI